MHMVISTFFSSLTDFSRVNNSIVSRKEIVHAFQSFSVSRSAALSLARVLFMKTRGHSRPTAAVTDELFSREYFGTIKKYPLR